LGAGDLTGRGGNFAPPGAKGPQDRKPETRVKLTVSNEQARVRTDAGRGTAGGPVADTVAVLSLLRRRPAETPGSDKQPLCFEEAGKTANDLGADRDTLVASARAYINALIKFPVKREQTTPGVMSA